MVELYVSVGGMTNRRSKLEENYIRELPLHMVKALPGSCRDLTFHFLGLGGQQERSRRPTWCK